jgi:anti-sigma regulatory factor (Ser/Thr protein kinase)
MREFIRRRAAEHDMDQADSFQAQLVATEAVTNAMRHGATEDATPISVTCLWRDDGLTIVVGDRGRFRHRERSAPDATGGRGMSLIEKLTRRFDLETSENGTKLRMLIGGVV